MCSIPRCLCGLAMELFSSSLAIELAPTAVSLLALRGDGMVTELFVELSEPNGLWPARRKNVIHHSNRCNCCLNAAQTLCDTTSGQWSPSKQERKRPKKALFRSADGNIPNIKKKRRNSQNTRLKKLLSGTAFWFYKQIKKQKLYSGTL